MSDCLLRPGLRPNGVCHLRFASRLPAHSVPSYLTAEARVSWSPRDHFKLFAAGGNLMQPSHQEFTGDNGNKVGIRREVCGGITWTP